MDGIETAKEYSLAGHPDQGLPSSCWLVKTHALHSAGRIRSGSLVPLILNVADIFQVRNPVVQAIIVIMVNLPTGPRSIVKEPRDPVGTDPPPHHRDIPVQIPIVPLCRLNDSPQLEVRYVTGLRVV